MAQLRREQAGRLKGAKGFDVEALGQQRLACQISEAGEGRR